MTHCAYLGYWVLAVVGIILTTIALTYLTNRFLIPLAQRAAMGIRKIIESQKEVLPKFSSFKPAFATICAVLLVTLVVYLMPPTKDLLPCNKKPTAIEKVGKTVNAVAMKSLIKEDCGCGNNLTSK